MVIHTHQHLHFQEIRLEGEVLVPFRVEVAMYDSTTIFERSTFKLDIRITAS